MTENIIAKNGIEPLKRAIAACEKAGTGGRVMVHIGGVETRALMTEILDLLRPGDILTHAYTGAPNLAGDFTNIVQDGRLLPAALAAKQRGVVFDVGHGGGMARRLRHPGGGAGIRDGLQDRRGLVGREQGASAPRPHLNRYPLSSKGGGQGGNRQPDDPPKPER